MKYYDPEQLTAMDREGLLAALVETRARAEEHAHRARLAERIAGLGHWRLEIATSKIQWSTMMHQIYGLDPGTPLDLASLMAMTHPDDAQETNARLQHALATGEAYEGHNVRIVRLNGEVRHLIGGCIVEKTLDGAVSALTGAVLDVTEQKRADVRLRESERRYRFMAENMTDMIVISSLSGHISFASNACVDMVGYTPEELVGRRALQFMHPDDVGEVACGFKDLLEGATTRRVRWRARHKITGEDVWLESGPCLLRNERTQAPEGFLDVVRNISAQIAQEHAILNAREAAEQSTAAKSEFLANMSHELRTPLTSILGFGRLVERQPELTEETRRYVHRTMTASNALLALVNDLLDLSKIEAGHIRIERGPASPREIVGDVLAMFDLQARKKGLTLQCNLSADVPERLLVDQGRIRQVLLNLIGNAVKFTDHGSVIVSATYEASTLRISVEDTGHGIARDQLQNLFMRFSQVGRQRSSENNGAGLGLAICRGIVDAMGGDIGVSSVCDEGSCFWFETPASTIAAEACREDISLPGENLGGVRVLVVDDHAPTRELVRVALSKLGADVQEASDGREAISAAASAPFDVILIDIRMPGVSGSETARLIRAPNALNADAPILAFSADGQTQALGPFDGHISKPIDLPSLVGAVSKWATHDIKHTEHWNVA